MAEGSGSSAVLGVIVGALLVGVVLLFAFGGIPWPGSGGGDSADIDVSIEAPAPE